MNDMTFSQALNAIKEGKKLSRRNWNGPDQYVEAQFPDDHSKMTLPYIFIRTVSGDLVPWLASQTDLLQDDWFVVD